MNLGLVIQYLSTKHFDPKYHCHPKEEGEVGDKYEKALDMQQLEDNNRSKVEAENAAGHDSDMSRCSTF